VLKRLGRQPWTMYTTTGWIVLITLGAVYVGSLVSSGDLHVRTLELIDQIDGRVVSRTHLGVIYSPRTQRYEVAVPEETWWRPASTQGNYYYGPSRVKTDVPFRQSAASNKPAPMTIPVWSLRTLRGDEIAPAPALLTADLRREQRGRHVYLVGTIRNAGPHLLDMAICARDGSAAIAGTLVGGGSMNVDVRLERRPQTGEAENAPSQFDFTRGTLFANNNTWGWFFAANSRPDRRLTSRVIDDTESDEQLAVFIGISPGNGETPIDVKGGPPAKREHRQVIRATFRLNNEGEIK
jgi:hypothetical protein